MSSAVIVGAAATLAAAYLAACVLLRLSCPRGYVEPPRAYREKLYALLATVDRVLREHGIPYWAESGTLLGAVRHGALIPWDDEADIAVPEAHDARLRALTDELRERGLALYPYACGFKIGFLDDPDEADRSEALTYKIARWFRRSHYPYVDVMSKREGADDFRYARPAWERLWPRQSLISKRELYPLTRYAFGPITLPGPRDPFPYLRRAYGDWETGRVTFARSQRRVYCAFGLFLKRLIPAAAATGGISESPPGSARSP